MKKVLFSAVALSVALVGCTAHNTTTKQDSKSMPRHPSHDTNAPHHKGMKPEDMKGEHPSLYACEQDTKISAKYDADNEIAKLRITAKTLGLNGQEVELKQAVSGSGVRYVNDKNPASIYEWHTKGGEGVLTITANGKQYNYSCEEKLPPKRP